jgi:hypothetical protein
MSKQKTMTRAITALLVALAVGAAGAAMEIPADKADILFLGGDRDQIGVAAAVGDFNGDGAPDLFLGAPGD